MKLEHSRLRLCAWMFFACLAPIQTVAAQGQEQNPVPIPQPRVFESQHVGDFNGQSVNYRLKAADTYIQDSENRPQASIFSFAYLKDGVQDPATRPVTFAWNGGPGSSSVWLHLGAFGPKRAQVPSDAKFAGAPPYVLEDNVQSLLDMTDLVFVDPVGTGFSRALGKHQDREFWGLTEDAQSIADFIRRWLTENGRWNSPKYLIGESYGTTRAAAVAGILEGSRPTVSLNGLVLLSQALDYTGSTPNADNLIAFVTYLPTMAATAWYHKKVPQAPASLEKFVDEARDFAINKYAPALFKGNRLDPPTRERIVQRLVYFTGLSKEYIEIADLRVQGRRFLKELLRREGKALGRLDSRYVADDVDDLAETPEGDATRYAIYGAFTALFNDYLHRQLGIRMDREYNIYAPREASRGWRFRPVPDNQRWEPSYIDTAPDLSLALRENEELRVLVASGYFDFATPFLDAEYTLGRHAIPADRITMTYYQTGHMIYLREPERLRLDEDIRKFFGERGGNPESETRNSR